LSDQEPGDRKESINYFHSILPKIKEAEGDSLGIVECIQGPGETIYVPGGWWHAVVNLDDTMAVTQNFMIDANFEDVWLSFRAQRKKLSHFFLRIVKKRNPRVYDRAVALNARDNFVMFPDRKLYNQSFKEDISTTSVDYSSSSDSSSSTSLNSSDADKDDSDSEIAPKRFARS
jgi:histone arginine demethylase JMJD6